MSKESFYNDPEPEKKHEIRLCPYAHGNPCAWRNACDYCAALCKQEIEDIKKEDALRAEQAKKAGREPSERND